jgi:hypothetical protein
LLFGSLVLFMLLVRRYPWSLGCRLGIQTAIFLAILSAWWLFIYGRAALYPPLTLVLDAVESWLEPGSRARCDQTLRGWLVEPTARKRLWRAVNVLSLNAWMEAPPRKDPSALWEEYRQHGATRDRILRSAALGVLYFAAGSVVFLLLGSTGSPCRGASVCALDGFVLGVSVLLMIFFLFLVVDATRLCLTWINKVQQPDVRWTGDTVQEWSRALDLPPDQASDCLKVRLIGERTAVVGRLLYYPLVVFLLMLLARSSYFDDWSFPLALAIVMGTNFAIAIGAAVKLNLAARQARHEIVADLRKKGHALKRDLPQPVATPEGIERLIGDLEQLKLGAYQAPWEQPFVRATIVVLSALLLTYAEYARVLM